MKNNRKKCKATKEQYKSLFFNDPAIKCRGGKTVYICQEHHDRILKILHVIAKNDVSLSSYLFNVLEHHFATYQEEITELYDNNHETPF